MPKKEWTEEERKAWGEKMRIAREKGAQMNMNPQESTVPEEEVKISKADFDKLMGEINALKAQQFTPQAPQVSAQGTLQGEQIKHTLDKRAYPDPTERLYEEKEFARFAPKENFNLYWRVMTTRYPNVHGVRVAEPRFEIEMRPRRFEEDGSYQGKEWVRQILVMHEDPDAALDMAYELGITPPETLTKDFLDEMRYQRCRVWLRELLIPPTHVQQVNNGRGEMVIGGTVVTTYENPGDFTKDVAR